MRNEGEEEKEREREREREGIRLSLPREIRAPSTRHSQGVC